MSQGLCGLQLHPLLSLWPAKVLTAGPHNPAVGGGRRRKRWALFAARSKWGGQRPGSSAPFRSLPSQLHSPPSALFPSSPRSRRTLSPPCPTPTPTPSAQCPGQIRTILARAHNPFNHASRLCLCPLLPFPFFPSCPCRLPFPSRLPRPKDHQNYIPIPPHLPSSLNAASSALSAPPFLGAIFDGCIWGFGRTPYLG